MSSEKFNSCPFCKGDEIESHRDGIRFAVALCISCGARGPRTIIKPFNTDEEVEAFVKKTWNQCDEPQHYEASR